MCFVKFYAEIMNYKSYAAPESNRAIADKLIVKCQDMSRLGSVAILCCH